MPITPHAANLGAITHHADNLGPITRNGRPLCHPDKRVRGETAVRSLSVKMFNEYLSEELTTSQPQKTNKFPYNTFQFAFWGTRVLIGHQLSKQITFFIMRRLASDLQS